MGSSTTRTTAVILLFTGLGCTIEATLPGDTDAGQAHAAAGAASHAPKSSQTAPRPAADSSKARAAAAGGSGGHASAAPSGEGRERADNASGAEADADEQNADSAPAPSESDSLPQEILGAWYTSSGHTSVPVDPETGSFGTPNGDSLLYQFNADGSYQKAFQSSASNAGCTTGFTATESGTMLADGHNLRLTPADGRIRYSDNCAPSLDSDKPIDDLMVESFTWELTDDGLQLTRDDGVSSTFVRAQE